jgi:hypothetical protein
VAASLLPKQEPDQNVHSVQTYISISAAGLVMGKEKVSTDGSVFLSGR